MNSLKFLGLKHQFVSVNWRVWFFHFIVFVLKRRFGFLIFDFHLLPFV